MLVFSLIVAFLIKISLQSEINGFDDTVLYDIRWPGPKLTTEEENQSVNGEYMILTTTHQEKYECFLPTISEKENTNEDKYDGPTALELIAPLFSQSSCSYRLDTYWTYEVCHGRSIRQYHEDREGKKVKLQEYTLGNWDKRQYEKLLNEVKELEQNKNHQIPVKKIDNINLPYLEILMDNGTLCELNQNKPRQTRVLYVCYVHGKHEVYSLKETSTCQYEIVILSPFLCVHPKYKPKESEENKIDCRALDGSPKAPYSLLKLRSDSAKMRKNSDLDRFRVELVELDKPEIVPDVKSVDATLVENFLTGKNCLNGGTGWWKYEFCYGKSVEQYHLDKDGTRTSIKLGYFDRTKHLKWIEAHPHKRPKPIAQRKQITHFYSDGTVCDKTGKPRQTEVKLKCLENFSSVNAVSLYLVEPRYCEYILGVESPLICDILARVDDNGLIEIGENEQDDSKVSVNNI